VLLRRWDPRCKLPSSLLSCSDGVIHSEVWPYNRMRPRRFSLTITLKTPAGATISWPLEALVFGTSTTTHGRAGYPELCADRQHRETRGQECADFLAVDARDRPLACPWRAFRRLALTRSAIKLRSSDRAQHRKGPSCRSVLCPSAPSRTRTQSLALWTSPGLGAEEQMGHRPGEAIELPDNPNGLQADRNPPKSFILAEASGVEPIPIRSFI
jgi:hypothetical protein